VSFQYFVFFNKRHRYEWRININTKIRHQMECDGFPTGYLKYYIFKTK